MVADVSKPLRLFSIHDCEDIECQVNVMVWCHTERYARRKMEVAYYRESGDWPDEKTKAGWHFEEIHGLDEYAPKSRREERRQKVQRLAGWMCEGDSQCESCELYEWGGDYPVCEDCCLCRECARLELPCEGCVEELADESTLSKAKGGA